MTTIISPVQLVGLKQAAYVMNCLARNDSEEQVVRMLGGGRAALRFVEVISKTQPMDGRNNRRLVGDGKRGYVE